MNELRGMLSLEDLGRFVDADQVDTVIAAFPDIYGRMMGKRFEATHFVEQIAENGTHACDYLLTVDMEMEPVAGFEYTNWEKGYGDFHLVPDLSTLRLTTWLERTALVMCDVHCPRTHKLVPQAPRSLLQLQVQKAQELGFEIMAGSEIEYYLFDTSYRQAHRRSHNVLRPASTYIEDYHLLQGTREEPINALARRHLSHSGIPVECTKGEWGCGQNELNLQYTHVLEMADRHTIYKQCMKEIADDQKKSVTFMAKYHADHAGSSCHIHISLWQDDQNAFAQSDTGQPTDQFRWFLGGWMKHLPELMVFVAPTVNSYKRYQSGSWAPTRIAWSTDNRTAGFRIVGNGPSLRIECRVPGADVNPYLAYASAIASGLDGIRNQIEPPSEWRGNVYEAEDVPHVPRSLGAAIDQFADADFARATFGDDVTNHYLHFYRTEQAAYERSVSDWERQRYFERI